MATRYPPVEPFATGLLDVGDGQRLYWEQCGNAAGTPALVLHGGPGSGCSPWMRQLFDPDAYRVILVDQRGAGRSTPHASDLAADLSVNTTAHLVADLERVREHLRVERWVVLGMSWGSTLALAYAQAHPRRVAGVVLGAVATTRRREVEWVTRGIARFVPEPWRRFRDALPAHLRGGDLAAGYAQLLASPDAEVRQRAAREWCAWEEALAAGEPGGAQGSRYADPRFRLGFARLVTHYFAHAAFLEEDQLLRDAHRLAGIPGVLVHGRLDLGSPIETAWLLARAWPGSELVALPAAGHDVADALVAATDRLAAAPPIVSGAPCR